MLTSREGIRAGARGGANKLSEMMVAGCFVNGGVVLWGFALCFAGFGG